MWVPREPDSGMKSGAVGVQRRSCIVNNCRVVGGWVQGRERWLRESATACWSPWCGLGLLVVALRRHTSFTWMRVLLPCLAVFNDPEVMAAVNDVAANPQNMKKYKNNAKVGGFTCLRLYTIAVLTWHEHALLCGPPVLRS